MTFKCDEVTRAALDAAASMTQAATILDTALGPNKRVRIKRDANASAPDPWATGVECRNVGATGALTVVAGRIRKFGKLKGTLVQSSADLSTGKSVLRIEGNGRWIEGSIGLLGSGNFDFTTNVNFTSNNGLALAANFAIAFRDNLPTGVGPAVPALTANAPATLEIWNWEVPVAPVLAGTLAFNTRAKDFVYEDREVALANGDIGVYQSNQSIMHGEFEIGMTMLVADKSNTVANTEPLYQVLGCMAHRGTWTTYPFADTYDRANHVTRPKPFKGILKNAAGNVLHVFEMHDGLAINDPALQQSFYNDGTGTKPLRPFTNCGMMLPWQNTEPKRSINLPKFYAGMNPNMVRPSIGKAYTSSIGVEPNITGGYQGNSVNGLANIYCAPRWPQPRAGYGPSPADPYMSYQDLNKDGGSVGYSGWAKGWDYEPGSYSLHNWYTGPGGPRHDRSTMPSVVTLWADNPNYVRIQDNVPIKDMFNGYSMGYFNHANHWVSDVKGMTLRPNKKLLDGSIQQLFGYYSAGVENPADPNGIYVKSDMRSGENSEHFDKENLYRWGGWGRDSLHSYTNAAWIALLSSSPMHAIGSKFDVITSVMMTGDPGHYMRGEYMVRDMAWRWMHWTMAWKVASDHPLGFTKAEIEEQFLKYFEGMYQFIYKPVVEDGETGHFAEGLRNLGLPIVMSQYGWAMQGTGLGYYMAHVMVLMKQFGLWSALRARSGMAVKMLDYHMANMDHFIINYILDTPMNQGVDPNVFGYTSRIPSSWAQYMSENPTGNASDLIRDAGGAVMNGDRGVNIYQPLQYLFARRDYFPEVAHPRLAAAVAKAEQYLADKAAYVAADSNPFNQTGRDFTYCYPALAPIKAPTELGPA
jgi:hypothetical protein